MGSTSKKANALTREQEIVASKIFGRHVDQKKAILLFVGALILAACPMIMGARLYDRIPEIVETGLVSVTGEDDSLPRWALVFLLPGIFTLGTIICHAQLWICQKKQKLPPTTVRLLGRWTVAVISVFFSSWAISRGADFPLSGMFYIYLLLACILLIAGGHFYGCSKDAAVAIRSDFTKLRDRNWNAVHNSVGLCCFAAGIIICFAAMLFDSVPPVVSIIIALLVILPDPLCHLLLKNK